MTSYCGLASTSRDNCGFGIRSVLGRSLHGTSQTDDYWNVDFAYFDSEGRNESFFVDTSSGDFKLPIPGVVYLYLSLDVR